MTVQLPRTSHKLVAPAFDYENTHLKKKLLFLEIQLHLHFSVKSHKAPYFPFNTISFNQIIWKRTVPAFQNTLIFDQY